MENKLGITPLTAGILALGLTLCGLFVGSGIKNFRNTKSLSVKGYAEKRITSDYAIWSGGLVTRARTLALAYEQMEKDYQKLVAFMEKSGIPRSSLEITPISASTRFRLNKEGYQTGEVDSYELFRTIKFGSKDIALVTRFSEEASKMLQEGLEINIYPPQYFYTKVDDLKIEMLGAATKDAQVRAEAMTRQTGTKLGRMRSASQGI
ncbi:MAG: SIMPL domain-containing protein, partial [Verrucomicrobiae bacterium]|nr:SIMPL domain-containing protein [Verrucomicrobiae bacterium]